jgi:hypothetical protein
VLPRLRVIDAILGSHAANSVIEQRSCAGPSLAVGTSSTRWLFFLI